MYLVAVIKSGPTVNNSGLCQATIEQSPLSLTPLHLALPPIPLPGLFWPKQERTNVTNEKTKPEVAQGRLFLPHKLPQKQTRVWEQPWAVNTGDLKSAAGYFYIRHGGTESYGMERFRWEEGMNPGEGQETAESKHDEDRKDAEKIITGSDDVLRWSFVIFVKPQCASEMRRTGFKVERFPREINSVQGNPCKC